MATAPEATSTRRRAANTNVKPRRVRRFKKADFERDIFFFMRIDLEPQPFRTLWLLCSVIFSFAPHGQGNGIGVAQTIVVTENTTNRCGFIARVPNPIYFVTFLRQHPDYRAVAIGLEHLSFRAEAGLLLRIHGPLLLCGPEQRANIQDCNAPPRSLG